MDIKLFEEFIEIYEAMSPEEKKAYRKARRESKKKSGQINNISKVGDDIKDIEDADQIDVKPSKSMASAVERYRTETIKLQDLQKEFVMTPKENIAKRESLKKKLIAQSKITKKAEADFERIVSAEEESFAEEMFFESLDITSLIENSISSSTIRDLDNIISEDTLRKFSDCVSEIFNELDEYSNDRSFEIGDVFSYLNIKIDESISY